MNPLRILVADDHEIVRRGLVSLLKSHAGWDGCGEAQDGREAVDNKTFFTSRVAEMVLGGYLGRDEPTAGGGWCLPALTPREREVVELLGGGVSTKEVACDLDLSVKTAETHRSNIMRKLNLHSVSELVLYAIKNNMINVVFPPLDLSTPSKPTKMAPIHPLRASSVVTSQMRRRNRMYRLVIGLLIDAVGSGVVVALLADCPTPW